MGVLCVSDDANDGANSPLGSGDKGKHHGTDSGVRRMSVHDPSLECGDTPGAAPRNDVMVC